MRGVRLDGPQDGLREVVTPWGHVKATVTGEAPWLRSPAVRRW